MLSTERQLTNVKVTETTELSRRDYASPKARMNLSFSAQLSKNLLFVFNLFFWLLGSTLLGVGIYTLNVEDEGQLYHLFTLDERAVFVVYLAWAFIVVGAVIFVVGFLGCCGAVNENRCMLTTYFVFLFVILATEIIFGILAIVFKDQTIKRIDKRLMSTFLENYGIKEDFTVALDYAQSHFNCCAVHGPSDYEQTRWQKEKRSKGATVPRTCCVLKSGNHRNPKPVDNKRCQSSSDNQDFRHQKGCIDMLRDFIRKKGNLFFGICIGVALSKILGMIFACCLLSEIRF